MEEIMMPGFNAPAAAVNAYNLHQDIIFYARQAEQNLLNMARSLKEMRDTKGYAQLGFESFEDYTGRALGLKQRQAYNYIAAVEKIPAGLLESHAGAGITKLELLTHLNAEDQETAAQGMEDKTVKELQAEVRRLTEERNGLAEQLSLLPAEPVAAEAEAHEVDMEAVERAAEERGRMAAWNEARDEMMKARAASDKELAEAMQRAKKAQEQAVADAVKQAKARAENAAQKRINEATAAARAEAEKAAEAKAAKELEQAQAARRAAEAEAAETAKKLQLGKSDKAVRFALLFEQMKETINKMMITVNEMETAGDPDAAKYRAALHATMEKLAQLTEVRK